jgi:putative colanic acid biosynthesis acetyltransferase WcaF
MESHKINYGVNYTRKEYLLRLLWSCAWPLFRFSPRIWYGWRNIILSIFGARIGKSVKIYPSADIMFPWNLEIGDRSVISWKVIIYNLGKISIGEDTVISQYAHLCAGNHDYKSPDFKLLKTPIIVGSRVWIAADAFIGPGVKVGDRSVIYARAVVVNDVEEATVMGGNPARVIRKV